MVFYELYVIIDIYSRYLVAWMVAPSESAGLAKAFIADAIAAQGIDRDQLTIHADRASRFSNRPPTPPKLPNVAWINPPTLEALVHSA